MKKQLLAFAAAACALSSFAQTVPTLSCSSLVSELNTGTLNGSKLGTSQLDPIWSQFQEYSNSPQTPPPNSVSWVQARTTVAVDPNWDSFNDAQWLSPGQGASGNQSAFGNWWPRPSPSLTPYNNHYRVQFNLSPEVPPSALRIEMEYMGDDVANAAYVNGTAVAPFSGNGFGGGVYTTLNTGWVSGLNTLVFRTADTGWAAGFLARARTAGESVCSVSPISVTKTADKASYVPGDAINYSVTVTSQGLVDATGLSLADAVPAGVANPVWSCVAGAGTAVCPSPISSNVVFDLPAQSSLVFSLSGTVTGRDSLDNTATITPGTGGVCSATTGCSASVSPSYTAAPPVAQAVPGLGAGALAALTASFGLLAWRRKKDKRMAAEN